MQNNKVEYLELCAQEVSIPIFMQPWWLDAVCTEGVTWDVVLVRDRMDIVVAAMAFCVQQKWGFKMIYMPHLTQYTGIWFRPSETITASRQQMVLKKIIAQIPHFHRLILRFNYNLKDWLPFYWAGFQQTTRYTYIIPNTSDLNAIFANFDSTMKREILHAQKLYTIEQSDDFDLFLILKSAKDNTPLSIWHSLETVLKQNQRRKIYFARNLYGEIDATAYIVWDNMSTYYLASGTGNRGRKYSAMHFLLWQAIQDSAERNTVFDFEGSMIESIASFFKRFGSVQMPYFQITKFNSRLLEWTLRFLNKI